MLGQEKLGWLKSLGIYYDTREDQKIKINKFVV